MQVRGSVIRSIDQFVSDIHRDHYDDWKNKLSPDTVTLMRRASNSSWYPIDENVIFPTEVLCKMFYHNDIRGAWESGRYSADVALTGLYKIFVLIASPSFLMKRASRVIATFYQPTELQITESTSKSMIIQFTKMPVHNAMVEHRIAGWMERALEICGCSEVTIKISKSFAKGDNMFETDIKWQ